MIDLLLILTAAMTLACLVLLLILVLRRQTTANGSSPDRTSELLGQLTAVERTNASNAGQLRADLATQRDELGNVLARSQSNLQQGLTEQRTAIDAVRSAIDQRLLEFAEGQTLAAREQRREQAQLAEGLMQLLRDSAGQLALQLSTQLTNQQTTLQTSLGEQVKALTNLQESLTTNLRGLGDLLVKQAIEGRSEDRKAAEAISAQLREQLALMVQRTDKLAETLKTDAETSRKSLEQKVADLQLSNEQRLDQMRQTVDEKLHATLEARLGQSFKLVSERLEAVQKGLGEMKSLADGVGDLKKVMTNVKTRGTWGEVQLRALIEDILRQEEYVEDYAPKGRGERVEFAVRLPGNQPDSHIFLPIDSKFPVEDYRRLVDAQDVADLDGVRIHGKALEDRIKGCAKDIADKYLVPGATTEFAILFLPFEGLYAEVLRRPGLAEHIQRVNKVMVCGPTTLGALLNSLRMGFRAVAIAKRSGDIGTLLSAVKTEFGNFGKVIDAVGSRLRQAQDEIEKVGTRTRAINRKLKEVEALPDEDATRLLANPGATVDDDCE